MSDNSAPTATVVDLSHWNTITSWPAIKAGGVQGIIHKASQGVAADPQYAARRPVAQKAGLLWGAYHYLVAGNTASQAKFFVKAAAPDANTLLAVDHEQSNVTVASLLTFMDAVEQATGRSCVLYSGYVIAEQGARGFTDAQTVALASHRFWLAEYTRSDPAWLADIWPSWWLWQYLGSAPGFVGKAKGITGAVDLDYYDGDALAKEWSGV